MRNLLEDLKQFKGRRSDKDQQQQRSTRREECCLLFHEECAKLKDEYEIGTLDWIKTNHPELFNSFNDAYEKLGQEWNIYEENGGSITDFKNALTASYGASKEMVDSFNSEDYKKHLLI